MKHNYFKALTTSSIALFLFIITTSFVNLNNEKSSILTTEGELTFTIRTVSEGGNYAPKHVLAIWVEYENDFVKTRLLRGNARKQYLYTWKAASDYNVVDAITGATLYSHTTHTVSWDCLDLDGNLVPDGSYTIWVEYTEKHAQGPLYSLSFTKGPDPITLTPSDETYFKDIELEFSPVSAGFICNTTEICQSEELTFTDESVNASDWDWDFGDGASPPTANTEGPHVVTYATPGLKTVSLTINESITETKENYIEVFVNPIADFEFSGMDLSVDFINNSTDAVTYLWDFGDGNSSTEENPAHIFLAGGSYMVSLQAINSICSDNITYDVLVPMVGLDELSQSNKINVYPNPNDGLFKVELSNPDEVVEIYMLDMTGRKTAFISSLNQSTITIELEKYRTGIYFLQINTDKNTYSKKLIVR